MQRDNPDEYYIIAMIYAKHPYLREMVNARIPSRVLGLAILSPYHLDTRNHVPVFDDELRRFVRDWFAVQEGPLSQRTCCPDSNALLCLVSIQ